MATYDSDGDEFWDSCEGVDEQEQLQQNSVTSSSNKEPEGQNHPNSHRVQFKDLDEQKFYNFPPQNQSLNPFSDPMRQTLIISQMQSKYSQLHYL